MPDFIEVGRFEDCQASHGREFARLWAATNENRTSIEELRRVVYQSKGAAIAINALVGFLSSAAGVALIKFAFSN